MVLDWVHKACVNTFLTIMCACVCRASRQDMAAMASPQTATSPGGLGSHGDHHTTLMEDPDVWRPT